MALKPAERTKYVVESPIRKIATLLEKSSADKDIISFGGGAPSLAPPVEIVDFLIENLKKEPQKTVAYGSTRGMPVVLGLIAELLKREEGVTIDPDKEITITDGGSEGIFLTLMAAVNPGDEVIVADPTYIAYREPVRVMGGRVVDLPVKWQDDFQMKPGDVAEKITKKTTAIVMLSPDNPTGRVMEKENVKGIVDLAVDHDLLLITDDVYKDIFFKGSFSNSRKFGGEDNTVTCCSFSKSGSIPGMRIGYEYGPESIIYKIYELKQYASLCPSKPAQICVQKLLENKARIKNEYIRKAVLPTYVRRRDVMADCFKRYLPEIGFSLPQGAFYFFVDMLPYMKRLGIKDDEVLSNRLFEEKKIALIPGKYFGPSGRNHLRFTFVSEKEERIREGFERIADFVKS